MSQISADFKKFMRGDVSLESAAVIPTELSTNLSLDVDDVIEIREERDEIEDELEAMIEAEPSDVGSIVAPASAISQIVDGAQAADPISADSYVPVANASLESFARILEVDVPRLTQELNGQISVESIDSLRGWVTQASSSFKASVKNFFARIALWWRRLFVTCERLRKRLNNIRARMSSRKGTGGKDLKMGKYAAGLVQGDGYAADPLAALATEAALSNKLSAVLLAAQASVSETLTSRLDQLLATDRPASATFRADLGKVIADLEATIASQPTNLLGNTKLITGQDDDFVLLEYVDGTPNGAMVAKNAGALRSLTPEQVTQYLDAIDVVLDDAIAAIRGIEKESARVCRIADTAVDRVASKYVVEREMTRQSVDDEGRPVFVTETESTSTIGRVMETEYEIVEVINGLNWTINTVLSRLMYATSGVLTLVEESVIQD
jgi:hypothetical protein